MRIVFMGTPDFAAASLKALYDSPHEVCAVFTQPDKPKGRGYKLIPPPVKTLALEHDTPVYQPKSLKTDADEYIEILKDLQPDCIAVAAYGKILPKQVLDIPKYGCINVHASLLPKYRGAAPIQRAIIDGEKYTGVTTMLMAEGLDTGDMLLQQQTEIGENETASELFERLADIGAQLLTETLKAAEKGSLAPKPQDDSLASYSPMIEKSICHIDLNRPVREVHKLICGLSEQPCAYIMLNSKRLKIYRSQIISDVLPDGCSAGAFVGKKHFDIACNDGVIRFCEIQNEGGKRMSGEAFLNGKAIPFGQLLNV